jgi:hypothetical protein
MAMEVHNTPMHDMDPLIKECVHFFHNRRLKRSFILVFLHSIFQASVDIVL